MKFINWEDIKDKVVKCPEHKVSLEWSSSAGGWVVCPIEFCGHYLGENVK